MFKLITSGAKRTFLAEGITQQGDIPQFLYRELPKMEGGKNVRLSQVAKDAQQGDYWLLEIKRVGRRLVCLGVFILKKEAPLYKELRFATTGQRLADVDP